MKRLIVILIIVLMSQIVISSCATLPRPRVYKDINIPEVVICSEIRGYGDYTEKTELLSGERFYIYAPLNNVSVMTENDKIRYVYIEIMLSIIGPGGEIIQEPTVEMYGRQDLMKESKSNELYFYMDFIVLPAVVMGEYQFILQVTDLITGKSSSGMGTLRVVPHSC